MDRYKSPLFSLTTLNYCNTVQKSVAFQLAAEIAITFQLAVSLVVS